MKKIIADPLDNYYNYVAITELVTKLSAGNQDMIEPANKEIEEYIESMKSKGGVGALNALGLSMRFATDSDFRVQMIEATIQHKAIIATFLSDNDVYFNDYLFPKIKELANYDFQDTRDYRLHKLMDFSFEQFQKELEMNCDDIILNRGLNRIELVKQYFLTDKVEV